MPKMSRRQVLSLFPAAGLVAAVARPAHAAATPDDQARILTNTTAILAGTDAVNQRPDVAGKIARIEQTARTRAQAMDGAGEGELFEGLELGTDDRNLESSYQGLYEIALATRTPGSALHGDAALQQRVINGLIWLHDNYYGDQEQGYYGNWFNWEIGISTHASRTLVLLADQLPTELAATYVASMDAYLRNGEDGDVDLDSRFHTGANLADITTNRILQGALLGDDARIAKAVSDQATVFATIDPYNLQHNVTDGYYEDGSFIQHHSVAYTGSYGKALLTRVVQTIKITDGTSYSAAADLVDVVRGWVTDGFAPLIFEGWMMEVVKGRAVSRTTTGYADVGVVVEAIIDLAAYATPDAARVLNGYVKFIRENSRAALDPSTFVSPVSIARYTDVLADGDIPAGDLNPAERTVAFNAMDRTVHRRPGYAFALARSSDRISKYEYMNSENLLPWFQGDGAYYLYLAGQDQTQAFGVDYYTTVSPYRLPGVTSPVEERKTTPELYGQAWYENPDHPLEFTSSSESQNKYVYFPRSTNSFSGGATLSAIGAAGMVQTDDVPYVDKQAGILPDDFVVYQNARSIKSWFLLDDEIVGLAADVHDPAGRATVTTLDSRIAAPTDDVVITGTTSDPWLRYANNTQGTAVGYVLLDASPVSMTHEQVTRSRRVIRASNPNTQVTKRVFNLAVEKPEGAAPAAFAYALVPNASEAQLQGYTGGALSVLANNRRIQAIQHTGLGLIAANVFVGSGQQADRLTIDGPASALMQERADGSVALALADPTMGRRQVTVVVRGRALEMVDGDAEVEVHRTAGGTRVTADTHQAHGRSFTAILG